MSKALRAAIATLLALGLFGCDNRAYVSSDNTTYVSQTDNNAGRFHSEAGQVAIVTDTRTGVQYLVWKCGYGGGVCVLVDADGKPLLAGDAE